MSIEFLERSEIIEECYEFMLAYAAQGFPGDQGSQAGTNITGEVVRLRKNIRPHLLSNCG